MRRDDREKRLAVAFELRLPDAVNAQHRVRRAGRRRTNSFKVVSSHNAVSPAAILMPSSRSSAGAGVGTSLA